ncbi:MAG: thioredoxin TrxC [bacterium]
MSSFHIVCPHCQAVNRVPEGRLSNKPVCGQCKKHLFEGHAFDLTHKAFNQQILKNDIPVVVDFWAAWCGPCQMMAPSFQQAAQKLEPHYRLLKLNTEKVPAVAQQYNIRSIPTIAVFKHGKELARQSGALQLNQLTSWIKQY